MTRIKSTAFEGVRVGDADVDSPSFERAMDSIIGDQALVFDKLTGSNGETGTINHDGTAGRGALLGIPYINHYVGRHIEVTGGGSSKDGGVGKTYLYACPIFIPSGETDLVVDILADEDFGMPELAACAFLRSTGALATVGDQERFPFHRVASASGSSTHWRARITGATSALHIFVVEIDTTQMFNTLLDFAFHSISVSPGRKRGRFYPGNAPSRTQSGTSPIPVTDPGATAGLTHVNFDSSLLTDANDALNGYLTTRVNRNMNGLQEYLTGWPAGGNFSYTQSDDADIKPTVSEFFAHTNTVPSWSATEPECDWPLWCEGFGSFKVEGGMATDAPAIGVAPSWGMLEHYAPWPVNEAAQVARQIPIIVPDFQTAVSKLKWAVIVGFDATAPTNWSVAVTNDTVGIGAPAVAFAAIVGGPGHIAIAQGTITNFDADDYETFFLLLQRTGVQAAVDELALLGVCVWFEP